MAGADTGILELPYQASGVIRKMRFVTISGDQTVAEATAVTARPIGVAKVDISSDEQTEGKSTAVQVLGVAWMVAGAAVTRADRVSSDTQGRAITATGAGTIPAGIALKAAGAAGDWIPVLLTPGAAAL